VTAAAIEQDLETFAIALEQSEDYKVLRRFVPRDRYITTIPAGAKIGLFVDVETTGLDKETAEIIELGMVPFYFDPDRGQILQVILERVYASFEEPKGEVSPEITEITGIEPDMLIGKRIDDDRANSLIADSVLVVAHNAEYDRPILERRLPAFRDKHWACSQREVKWDSYGAIGAKLGNILAGVCGQFYEAHRALDDCRVGVHVLAHQRKCDNCDGYGTDIDGPCEVCVAGIRSPFTELLTSARLPVLRVYADGTAFTVNQKLKARKYRFDGKEKSWFKDVRTEPEAHEEQDWLRDIVAAKGSHVVRITAKDRFSARVA
jgi:DNA polymerase-3 subunit epsilon